MTTTESGPAPSLIGRNPDLRRPLRIAQVTPPLERVPPSAYGGTERVVFELVGELHRRGHQVTTFASGDSEVPGRLIQTVPKALRPAGQGGDPGPWFDLTVAAVMERAHEFDLIHSHLEAASAVLARAVSVPVVSTFHGRLDFEWAPRLLKGVPGLVAISRHQASALPEVRWAGIVHNGLSLEHAPFERRRGEGLVFVGRVAPEKGIIESIEIARLTGRPLTIAAKIGTQPDELAYYEEEFKPALEAAGDLVEFVGEVDAEDRDRLLSAAYALLMPGSWPEPFGLTAIEALATGTPVLTRRVGALPEIIREGVDGFFGDDAAHMAFLADRVAGLDREAIRESVLQRFSAKRMTDDYAAVYAKVMGEAERRAEAGSGVGRPATPAKESDEAGLDEVAERVAAVRGPGGVAGR
ncbi:MAG: glycosyltransferase family 4 protein [Chloroflexota bacterium]